MSGLNQFSGKPLDKANKPIYIVTVQDGKDGLVVIKTRQDFFNIYPTHIDVRGIVITKTQANSLKKEKELDRSLGEPDSQVHLIIPLHKWIKTENISFDGIAQKNN